MKRFVKLGLLVAVALVFLGGCAAFLGLFFDVNPAAGTVEVDDTGAKGIETVTVTIVNAGPRATIPYGILLSNGTSLSYASDVIIYEGEVEVALGAAEVVTISRAQIDSYMAANAETAANGTYYVGLWVDPLDRLGDADTSDNQAVSSGEYSWVQ